MSNLLFDYIQNVLAPKEYRLELKNRLENLCSLSGQTMSPGLTKWLTKTFGVEMVRVIQDYATLGGNKFPPDYFEKIKRLVPGNYKGYNANQGFRQLFDVNCCDDMYIVSFTDNTWSSFTGWTLNGYADFDWGNLAASFGGTYILDFAGIAPPFSPPSQATFIYQGATPPPDLVGTDAFSNPVSYSFTKYCQKSVFQAYGFAPGSGVINQIKVGDIQIELSAYGGPVDMYIDADNASAVITSALQAYFGPNAFAVTCVIQPSFGSYAVVSYHNVYGNVAEWESNGMVQFNASNFDLASIGPFTMSDIAFDAGTGNYTYASQFVQGTYPIGFTPVFKVTMDPTLNILWQSSVSEIIANGTTTTTTPTTIGGFVTIADLQFFSPQSGNYLTVTSKDPGIDITDIVKILNPYDSLNEIDSITNTITQ